MRVPRKLIGKFVEINWRDPQLNHTEDSTFQGGWEALAYQKDWGVLAAIKDGVVMIAHCAGQTEKESSQFSFAYSVCPEALIESIRVFKPCKSI